MDNNRSPASLMINLEPCQQGSGSAIESGSLWPTLLLLVLQQAMDKLDLCFYSSSPFVCSLRYAFHFSKRPCV